MGLKPPFNPFFSDLPAGCLFAWLWSVLVIAPGFQHLGGCVSGKERKVSGFWVGSLPGPYLLLTLVRSPLATPCAHTLIWCHVLGSREDGDGDEAGKGVEKGGGKAWEATPLTRGRRPGARGPITVANVEEWAAGRRCWMPCSGSR